MTDRTLVFTYGRFNPPTVGHQQVIQSMELAKQGIDGSHIIVGVSRTEDKKKNPLPVSIKLVWLRAFFPDINFHVASERCPSFVQMLEQHSAFYNRLYFMCGADRMDEYKAILDKYNDELFKFDHYEVTNVGYRDPASEGIAGMSGSKMRQFVKDNDYESFVKGLPRVADSSFDVHVLWQELRQRIN